MAARDGEALWDGATLRAAKTLCQADVASASFKRVYKDQVRRREQADARAEEMRQNDLIKHRTLAIIDRVAPAEWAACEVMAIDAQPPATFAELEARYALVPGWSDRAARVARGLANERGRSEVWHYLLARGEAAARAAAEYDGYCVAVRAFDRLPD